VNASTVLNISDNSAWPDRLRPSAFIGQLDRLDIHLPDPAHVLMAVSGGPDSLGMAASFYHLQQAVRPDLQLSAVTVDHHLRPESTGEAYMVANYMQAIGIDHVILNWVDHGNDEHVSMADARQARYDLMIAHAKEIGATHLATGHQLTDQADTILQRIAHGSGIDGLAGIPPTRDQDGITIIRPVLNLEPDDLKAACRAMGWDWAVDPTNRDPNYTRGKLNVLRDALNQAGFDEGRLSRVAKRARLAKDALDYFTDRAMDNYARWHDTGYWQMDWAGLSNQPVEIIHRAIIRGIRGIVSSNYPPRFDRLSRAVTRLNQNKQDRLTLGGCLIERDHDRVIMCREVGAMAPALHRGQGDIWDHRLIIDWDQLDSSVVKIARLTNDRWAVARDRFEPLDIDLPLSVRRSLPVYLNPDDQVIDIPHLSGEKYGLSWKNRLLV
jgi:tRNA(Ile)-lysidine synthase